MGRSKVYEAIIKGSSMGKPGVPESFKVLIKELRSLGLDMKTLSEDGKEVNIDEEGKTPRRSPRIFGRDRRRA